MSYVLDGIQTAMVEDADGAMDLAHDHDWVTCPCGWRSPSAGSIDMSADVNALRFHYMHCQHAKPPCKHHRKQRLLGPGDCFTCMDCGTTIG